MDRHPCLFEEGEFEGESGGPDLCLNEETWEVRLLEADGQLGETLIGKYNNFDATFTPTPDGETYVKLFQLSQKKNLYAASKIQSVLKSPSTQVVNMYGRKYEQRDWKH
eukprot:SAG22_NODE_13312_length_410_cov_47.369775_1_plen_108_part_01